MNRKKYLVKNTLIFSLGNLGTRLISFFLVPLYTSALSTEQYGTVDLISTIAMIVVPVIFLNIGESVMRFSLDKNADTEGIISIGICVVLFSVVPGIILSLGIRFYDPVSKYTVFIFLYSFTMGFSQVLLCYLRGRELLIKYSIGNIIQALLIALFNIIFLLVFKWGINGYLASYILAYTFVILYCFLLSDVGKIIKKIHFNISLAKDMIKYSVVLISNSFMWWIMNSSDRVMVTSMVGVEANGIYAISYKLPTLVSTITSIFNQAWGYSAIHEEGSSDEAEYNNDILKKLSYTVFMTGILIIIFSKSFLRFYVSPDYYEAWRYMPFLTIGCVYLALGTFMATSYTVHKDSFGYLFSSMFGAILNIALNFTLIPLIDVYGAATATCLSYIAVFAFRIFHTRKYIKYKVFSKEFVVGTCIMFIVSILTFEESIYSIILQGVLFVAFVLMGNKLWLSCLKSIRSVIAIRGVKNG